MYLVDIRLESAARLSPAEVRGLLARAARPGDGVEHIYVQPVPPATALSRGPTLHYDAVLFLSHPTLTESERAADAVLGRCTTRGLRLRRLSAMPLTLLVDLLSLEG
ncbi:hypothetical protein PV390_28555 [Streptomyces sp. ME02-6991-2A]|uniref:hypothetical protein n=1 Tax=Streptomyces TaxID=1883 RepID=UPI0029BA94C5|nr:hypothetical protein [Streptomyces sp. ME02-6991-2A]MDX3378356.1 hypothetical protein [Streptomyces sp. ME02-6991-2A]